MAQQEEDEPMESIKMSPDMGYSVMEANERDIFDRWKKKGCEVHGDRKMLRLDLNGTVKKRSELRNSIFEAIEKGQQMRRDDGKEEKQMITLEAQIPSIRCGFVIGTNGDTIKQLKAESGVCQCFIDEVGKQNSKVNRKPQPGYSWVVIGAYQVENLAKAWAKLEELLELANKLDPHIKANGRARTNARGEENMGRVTSTRVRIPAAEFFNGRQRKRFEEIRTNGDSNGVRFELDSSDPGAQYRLVTLVGTQNRVLISQMELNELINEVMASKRQMNQCEISKDQPPSPPTPIPSNEGNSAKKHVVDTQNSSAPSDPAQPKKAEKYTENMLVPALCVVHVIGNRGETIRRMKEKFGVKMTFLGENHMDYPNGRTLSITGDSMEKVQKAKQYVDEQFILSRWEFWNTGQRDIDVSDSVREEVHLLQPQFSLRNDLEPTMMKIKDHSGILSYSYRGFRSGYRPIVLKGTQEAIDKALKMLNQQERQWAKELEITAKSGIARSLDDISINSFAQSLHRFGQSKDSKPPMVTKGLLELSSGGGTKRPKLVERAKGPTDAEGRHNNDHMLITGADDPVNRSYSDETEVDGGNFDHPSNRRIAREFDLDSDSIVVSRSNDNGTESQQQQTKKTKKEKTVTLEEIIGEMAEKVAEMRKLMARMACIECGISERSVLFTPCRHFLFCKECSANFPNCPICKNPSKKLEVHLE